MCLLRTHGVGSTSYTVLVCYDFFLVGLWYLDELEDLVLETTSLYKIPCRCRQLQDLPVVAWLVLFEESNSQPRGRIRVHYEIVNKLFHWYELFTESDTA